MTVGIVGLGLIGGSMAKAYKEDGKYTVLATDIDRPTLEYARISGVVDDELTQVRLRECELIFIALYPLAAIEYLNNNSGFISASATVIDLCGTKSGVCRHGFELAEKFGYCFVGGHPMAGSQYSGFKHSRATLFSGAPMVIVPPRYDDIFLLDKIKQLLSPCKFGKISISTAEKHDELIAFTSQLAHVVSNAYVKSPTAQLHTGFSAGSYKDLTRVAKLNENMWAELFIENKSSLVKELDRLIGSLSEYKTAIANSDLDSLKELLRSGSDIKEQIDGRSVKKA